MGDLRWGTLSWHPVHKVGGILSSQSQDDNGSRLDNSKHRNISIMVGACARLCRFPPDSYLQFYVAPHPYTGKIDPRCYIPLYCRFDEREYDN